MYTYQTRGGPSPDGKANYICEVVFDKDRVSPIAVRPGDSPPAANGVIYFHPGSEAILAAFMEKHICPYIDHGHLGRGKRLTERARKNFPSDQFWRSLTQQTCRKVDVPKLMEGGGRFTVLTAKEVCVSNKAGGCECHRTPSGPKCRSR